MPTYQYRCTECGHDLEAVQKFSDDPLTECPVCHGRLRKVYSAVGIVFKGSGFYATDSKSKNTASKPAPSADTTTAPASSGSSDASSTSASTSSSTGGTTSA